MHRWCWRAIPRSLPSAAHALRHLLYLFKRDEAIRLIRAGVIRAARSGVAR
jgi:hypothetical protein